MTVGLEKDIHHIDAEENAGKSSKGSSTTGLPTY
jgi:hypothetical protein